VFVCFWNFQSGTHKRCEKITDDLPSWSALSGRLVRGRFSSSMIDFYPILDSILYILEIFPKRARKVLLQRHLVAFSDWWISGHFLDTFLTTFWALLSDLLSDLFWASLGISAAANSWACTWDLLPGRLTHRGRVPLLGNEGSVAHTIPFSTDYRKARLSTRLYLRATLLWYHPRRESAKNVKTRTQVVAELY
jgi:hypothetical protein